MSLCQAVRRCISLPPAPRCAARSCSSCMIHRNLRRHRRTIGRQRCCVRPRRTGHALEPIHRCTLRSDRRALPARVRPDCGRRPRQGAGRTARSGELQGPAPSPVIASGEIRPGSGGSRLRGVTAPTGVNDNPEAQPDAKLRELNSQPSAPGPREEVYCTRIGATRPDEMYIIGAHMDGIGWGEAADDNASGTALVMELARVLNSPDVRTERSIRFALWNNEETGLNGSRAYVAQRAALQGKEDPSGSGRYPEPKWLGMIQHDMPRADGTLSPEQRPEADVNIEFQSASKFADQALQLAFLFRDANEKYATDYPAAVGHHMTNTDSTPFMDFAPAISVREHERGMHIGAGWNPHWHQPTDRYATYSEKDFRLGLNAAQTTLAAIAQLAGAALG